MNLRSRSRSSTRSRAAPNPGLRASGRSERTAAAMRYEEQSIAERPATAPSPIRPPIPDCCNRRRAEERLSTQSSPRWSRRPTSASRALRWPASTALEASPRGPLRTHRASGASAAPGPLLAMSGSIGAVSARPSVSDGTDIVQPRCECRPHAASRRLDESAANETKGQLRHCGVVPADGETALKAAKSAGLSLWPSGRCDTDGLRNATLSCSSKIGNRGSQDRQSSRCIGTGLLIP